MALGRVAIEIGLEGGAQFERNLEQDIGGALKSFGRDLKKIGGDLSRAVTLPLAGLAAGAFRFSSEASRAFKSFGDRTKKIFGDLGTDIARSIDLDDKLQSLSSIMESLVKTFKDLNPRLKEFLITLGFLAAAAGPLASWASRIFSVLSLLIRVFSGPAGLIALMAGAAVAANALAFQFFRGAESAHRLSGSVLDYARSLSKEDAVLADVSRQITNLLSDERIYRGVQEDILRASRNLTQATDQQRKTFEEYERRVARVNEELTQLGRIMRERISANSWFDIATGVGRVNALFQKLAPSVSKVFDAIKRGVGLGDVGNFFSRLFKPGKEETRFRQAAIEAELLGGGVNMTTAAISALVDEYQRVADTPLGTPEKLAELRAGIDGMNTSWMHFVGLMQQAAPTAQLVGTEIFNIFQQVATGVGNAIAQIIVFGADAGETFKNLGKQILATIIATFVSLAIQFVIFSILQKTVLATMVTAQVSSAAATAAAWAVAWAIATEGLIGFATAAAHAAAAAALVVAGSAIGAGIGAGASAGIAVADEGGIFMRPSPRILAGPNARGGEIALTRRNVREFLGVDNRPVHVHLSVDGRAFLEAVFPHFGPALRTQGVRI